MTSPMVWFDTRDNCLVFATGDAGYIHGDFVCGMLDLEAVRNTPYGELEKAIESFATRDHGAGTWRFATDDDPTGETTYLDEIGLVFEDDQLIALAIGDIPFHADEEYEIGLPGLLTPLADRFGVEIVGGACRPFDGWVAMPFRPRDRARPIGELLDVASLAQPLMLALRQGPLDATTARDLVSTGHGEALVGLAEGAWLDVKRQPYPLGGGRADATGWELAKDVAAFANSAGGIIVIPGRERAQHGRALIEAISDLPLEQINVQRVRDVLAARVYPVVDDLEIATFETAPGRGVFWIYVPEQAEELKPFLVHGALSDAKVLSTHVSIPRRVGADTRHAPIAELHALLVAGRGRRLGREEILDIVRRDQLPRGFRELVESAENAGVAVVLGNGALRFDTPDGVVIESQYSHVPNKLLDAERERLRRELAPYGLSVATSRDSAGAPLGRGV